MTNRARTLPRAGSYWTAAAVAAIALWTSGAPSTTYPLYAADWHLTATVTTAVFALYPLALVVVLVLFGDISDHIGRRATILIGLAALLVGSLLFAVAPDIAVVFIGRAFMGFGVGLALSPASAAVVEFSQKGREGAASSVFTAGTAVGLALATLIGGALIQYAPFPLHLDFWVLVVAIAVTAGLVWFMPRHTRDEDRAPWRPRLPHVAPGLRMLYAVSAGAVIVSYMFGSVFLALGADVAEQLTGTSNVLVVGAVMAIMSVFIGATAIATRGVTPRTTVMVGVLVTLVALALLLTASQTRSFGVFVVTMLVAGAAYALMFSGGLGLISRNAPAHHRAGTISAVYLVAYVMQGVTAVVLGLIATADGLALALVVGAIAITVFALATLGTALALRPQPKPDELAADAPLAARAGSAGKSAPQLLMEE